MSVLTIVRCPTFFAIKDIIYVIKIHENNLKIHVRKATSNHLQVMPTDRLFLSIFVFENHAV